MLAMPHRLIAKLDLFTRLSDEEQQALREVTGYHRQTKVREDLGPIRLILDGWACRYKQVADGRRQIMALLLPGDLCDPQIDVLRAMDHSIGAVTCVTLAEIAHDRLADLAAQYPRVGAALAWEAQVGAAIQREWTVNLGQRDAVERLAHLFCELSVRLRGIGLVRGDSYEMPLRQTDLAAATGLTSVHVNRSLQTLRAQGWIVLRGRCLTILDSEALQHSALFDPSYLHADRAGAHPHTDDR